jgi:carbonic anhydrase
MSDAKFVTAITCMDGRVQQPVSDWMRQTFAADYVDTITEPGPDGILAGGDTVVVAAIRRRLEISAKAHGSRVVAIVAHDDCAGNPVAKKQHLEQLGRAAELVRSWGLPMQVVTVWVNEAWAVERVG